MKKARYLFICFAIGRAGQEIGKHLGTFTGILLVIAAIFIASELFFREDAE